MRVFYNQTIVKVLGRIHFIVYLCRFILVCYYYYYYYCISLGVFFSLLGLVCIDCVDPEEQAIVGPGLYVKSSHHLFFFFFSFFFFVKLTHMQARVHMARSLLLRPRAAA
jgi:hypothetical protein